MPCRKYLEMEKCKTIQYGDDLGKVIYTKRHQNRRIRITVDSCGDIKVSLPRSVSFTVAEAFLAEKMEWAIRQRRNIIRLKKPGGEGAPETPEERSRAVEELRRRAKKILPERLRAVYELMTKKIVVRNIFGMRVKDPFRYNRVAIKNNVTNWGSCSTLRNINLNMHLVELPAELMDFVIAHELCHLVYRNHGPKFHKMLDAVVDGRERELNRRLNSCRPQDRR